MFRKALPFVLAVLVATTAAAARAGSDAEAPGASRAAWLMQRPALEDRALVGFASGQVEIGGAAAEPVTALSGGDDGGGSRKALHILSSLVLPGSGEAMLGYRRGYLMMAADIFAWTRVFKYDSDGDDLQQEFFQFADDHWSLDKLTAAYAGQSIGDYVYDPNELENDQGVPLGQAYMDITTINSIDDLQGNLPLYVSVEADHWEYYENLGKWDQFVFGWDDFVNPYDTVLTGGYVPTGTLQDLRQPFTSKNRDLYREMRGASDDAYSKRDTWLMVNVGLRIFSVIQTAYLDGVLGGGGEPRKLEVSGHEISFRAQPMGKDRGLMAAAVSF